VISLILFIFPQILKIPLLKNYKLKKKVLLGVIVELITFIPLVFLIILFRKTKSVKKRSNNIRKTLPSIFIDESVDFRSKSKESIENEGIKKSFKFPWFFKVILYSISLFVIVFSNLFVLFKGNSQNLF
jgi:hypothetical protein